MLHGLHKSVQLCKMGISLENIFKEYFHFQEMDTPEHMIHI